MLYKLDNGTLIVPTNTIVTEDGKIMGNMADKDSYWAALGYKPLNTSIPQPDESYTEIYTETETEIIRDWEKIETPTDERILLLREKYKQSTRSLCQLAGVESVDKLEDSDYENVATAAAGNEPIMTNLLTQTIMYCLFQLYRLDGNDAWERI